MEGVDAGFREPTERDCPSTLVGKKEEKGVLKKRVVKKTGGLRVGFGENLGGGKTVGVGKEFRRAGTLKEAGANGNRMG